MFFSKKSVVLEKLNLGIEMDCGAPCPVVLSDERTVFIIFNLAQHNPDWDGSTVHIRDNDNDSGVACIQFKHYKQFKFGMPNDEACYGHKYYKYGLKPYEFYEVKNSDWYAELEKINSVHPYHNKERFLSGKHYLFFFHDSSFEIICEEISVDVFASDNLNAIAKQKAAELYR